MELNWSTFILEIINFVVLVWILKHFLYKPVLDVIARRRAGIEQTLEEAKQLRSEAETLQEQYEGRLADWEQERQKSRDALAREIENERSRRMAELETALQDEQERTRVADTRTEADNRRRLEAAALRLGGRFASRLLELGAGAETERRLLELLIEELAALPAERVSELRNSWAGSAENIRVSSAFELAPDQIEALQQGLDRLIGQAPPLHIECDPGLLAGVQITIGPWTLNANLRDELAGFVQLSHEN